jgi:hypothetical protein
MLRRGLIAVLLCAAMWALAGRTIAHATGSPAPSWARVSVGLDTSQTGDPSDQQEEAWRQASVPLTVPGWRLHVPTAELTAVPARYAAVVACGEDPPRGRAPSAPLHLHTIPLLI